jgi:hypothetical protein
VVSIALSAVLFGWLGLCALIGVCMFGTVVRYRLEGARVQRALADDIRQYRLSESARH